MKLTYILLILFIPTYLLAKSYPIFEEDLFEAISRYSETKEFKEKVLKDRDEKVKTIVEMSGIKLPTATDNYTYKIVDSYTLTQDIPRVDREGNIIGVLYKKGFKFNPLKFIKIAPPSLIIFDACNIKEKKYVQNLIKTRRNFMLVSGGCQLQNIEGFREMVYLTNQEMIDKFKLKTTISIVEVNIKEAVYEIKVIATN